MKSKLLFNLKMFAYLFQLLINYRNINLIYHENVHNLGND